MQSVFARHGQTMAHDMTAIPGHPEKDSARSLHPVRAMPGCWRCGKPSAAIRRGRRQAYALAETLVDCEDYFRRWRFNHVIMVERVIGIKRGTGATSSVSYLRRILNVQLFREVLRVRTML